MYFFITIYQLRESGLSHTQTFKTDPSDSDNSRVQTEKNTNSKNVEFYILYNGLDGNLILIG